jgi:hypothetical protein
MIGEIHSNQQEYDWYRSLVATPEFADRVDDIVLEMGNSLYQTSVDQYVSGEDIPLQQIQKAGRNTVGFVGPQSPPVAGLYQTVRETNMKRPGKHQMRILCGDPYIDWDKVQDEQDVIPYARHRDDWYAQVVKKEVLAKNHRALLIMGAMDFLRNSPDGPRPSIEPKLRRAGAKTHLIMLGTNTPGERDHVDHRFDSWTAAVIAPASGWIGEPPAQSLIEGGGPPTKPNLRDAADAILYLGPRESLMKVSTTRAQLEGTPYGAEIMRRLKIRMILQSHAVFADALFPERKKARSFPLGERLFRGFDNQESSLNHYTAGFQRNTGFLAAAVSSSRETRVECGASSTVRGSSCTSSAIDFIASMNKSISSFDSLSVGSIIRAPGTINGKAVV